MVAVIRLVPEIPNCPFYWLKSLVPAVGARAEQPWLRPVVVAKRCVVLSTVSVGHSMLQKVGVEKGLQLGSLGKLL